MLFSTQTSRCRRADQSKELPIFSCGWCPRTKTSTNRMWLPPSNAFPSVQRTSFDLAEGVRVGVEKVQDAAKRRGLAINTEIEGRTISTDPGLWAAILNNLLGNVVSHARRRERTCWWRCRRVAWRRLSKNDSTQSRLTCQRCKSGKRAIPEAEFHRGRSLFAF